MRSLVYPDVLNGVGIDSEVATQTVEMPGIYRVEQDLVRVERIKPEVEVDLELLVPDSAPGKTSVA